MFFFFLPNVIECCCCWTTKTTFFFTPFFLLCCLSAMDVMGYNMPDTKRNIWNIMAVIARQLNFLFLTLTIAWQRDKVYRVLCTRVKSKRKNKWELTGHVYIFYPRLSCSLVETGLLDSIRGYLHSFDLPVQLDFLISTLGIIQKYIQEKKKRRARPANIAFSSVLVSVGTGQLCRDVPINITRALLSFILNFYIWHVCDGPSYIFPSFFIFYSARLLLAPSWVGYTSWWVDRLISASECYPKYSCRPDYHLDDRLNGLHDECVRLLLSQLYFPTQMNNFFFSFICPAVLPNLPCAPLEYINWRPLTGQSFRLWRNVEYTPDFLNKLRWHINRQIAPVSWASLAHTYSTDG